MADSPFDAISSRAAGGIDPEHAAAAFHIMLSLQKMRQESKAAAIQYQGQMQYQKDIEAGMDPALAMRKNAPRMFYRHPAGITAAIKTMQPAKDFAMPPQFFEDQGVRFYRDPNTGKGWSIVPPARQLPVPKITASPEWVDYSERIKQKQAELAALRHGVEVRKADALRNNKEFTVGVEDIIKQDSIMNQLEDLRKKRLALKPTMPTVPMPPTTTTGTSAPIPALPSVEPTDTEETDTEEETDQTAEPPQYEPESGATTPAAPMTPPTAPVAPTMPVKTYPDPLPMRLSKEELIPGQRYVTKRGVATWDGSKFVKE